MPPAAAPPQTLKRINRELLNIHKELPEGILSVGPKSSDNIYDWQGSIAGPSGSCYEHGVFHFNILLPHDYPFHPPTVSFVTRIFHPNINPQGAICLDILTHKWSPALSIQKVLLSIMCLLTDPNPQDPLVRDIARLYMENRSQFESTARQWVDIYARPPPAPFAEKLKDEPKKATPKTVTLTTGAPKTTTPKTATGQTRSPVIDLDDDDEIQVVKISSKHSLQAATTSRKRSGEINNSLQTAATSRKRSADHSTASTGSSFAHDGPSSSSAPSASNPQAKRARQQIIELD